MNETRFAILIGMDNYNGNELPYCVKDVVDLEETLITKCRFIKDNIFKVTDSKMPVKQQIDNAYSAIEKSFRPKQDLLFFYFSGHGEYDNDEQKSKILFEDDTELTIEDILIRYFLKLTPKNQYLLIDACHSGSNVFFKGSNNPEKEIRRLNYNSTEFCLMFATESKKKAIQSDDIKNSYFTFYLIEAIKKLTLYDEDGFLTILAIDNYIKKKVIEKSEFLQIPVSEIRSSGYKVFSFDETVIQQKAKPQLLPNMDKSSTKEIEKEIDIIGTISFEESLLPSHREKVQEKYSIIIKNSFDALNEKLIAIDLDVIKSNPLNEMDYSDQQKVFKKIIEKSKEKGIDAVNGLFEVEQRQKRNPKFWGGLSSIIDDLYEQAKPDHDYKINIYSDQIFTVGLSVKAKNVYQVTGGIFALFFQAKYGFAICTIQYHYDWTGVNETDLKYINLQINPYLLNQNNDEEVVHDLTKNIDNFNNSIKLWGDQRKKEIDDFMKKFK
ncbi:MAG: caspase family protein [Paludibacter sp.]|nr:caspase family protein [Paludibacter sp.]